MITQGRQRILAGTTLKMVVNFQDMDDDGLRLEDIDFHTEWYCTKGFLRIEKDDHIFEDGECYALVDTGKIGSGILKMRLWAEIPDIDSESGVRIEYAEYVTDIVIM